MTSLEGHNPSRSGMLDFSARLNSDLTDAQLARALCERHRDALTLAMARFDRVVRGMLWQAFRCSDEWRDARQEVFLCLFRDVNALRDPELLRAFVIGITRNIIRAELRRRHLRAAIRLEPELSSLDVIAVPGQAVGGHELNRLQALLHRLRTRERVTFVLRFVDRMTVLEIADRLGMSSSTVQRSLRMAWSRVVTWAARDPFLIDYLTESSLDNKPLRADAARGNSLPPRGRASLEREAPTPSRPRCAVRASHRLGRPQL